MDKSMIDQKIKPELKLEDYNQDGDYAKFVCLPLERGYGMTLGNALQRVILSSLTGAAVTAVKIHGLTKEMRAIDRVLEDVTDIILNVKQIRLKLQGVDHAELKLDAKGPAVLTAGHFESSPKVEIINKSSHLATLQEGGRLTISLKAEKGRSYVHAVQERADPGWTAVDAMFSPVTKVNFTVSNTTHGRRTDYDKLTLEVWTDGRITPEEAVTRSARIITEQLSVFSSVAASGASPGFPEELEEVRIQRSLDSAITALPLSKRAVNCLEQAEIRYVWQLVRLSREELERTKNLGRKSLMDIVETLSNNGLSLGMDVGDKGKAG
jgi:DNA-directed RNA polymerase subunit alpha